MPPTCHANLPNECHSYIFQTAAGSQQMFDLVIDLERAAIRRMPSATEKKAGDPSVVATKKLRKLPESATKAGRPIMQYVMIHDPGNTVNSQRRRFYASLGHGALASNTFCGTHYPGYHCAPYL